MRTSMRTMVVILTIVMSLIAVQSTWAGSCNTVVSGEITAVDYNTNSITVEDTTVYGIPLNYLANKLNIFPQADDYAVITTSQCPSTGKLTACTISLNGGAVIYLPAVRTR